MPKVLPSKNFLDTGMKGKTLVAGVGGVESNFLIQSVPCVRSYNHQDLPAILVFIEYLCALEVGLSDVTFDPENGITNSSLTCVHEFMATSLLSL